MEEMTREDLIQLVESLKKELKDVKETKDFYFNRCCKYEERYDLLRNTLENILKMTESN
jgi:hypothetical protein